MTRAILILVFATGCAGLSTQSPPVEQGPTSERTETPDFPVKSVAVLPIVPKGGVEASLTSVLDDLLLTNIQSAAASSLRVIGKSDIDAVLGLEATKDALGCTDTGCAVEIAGALGVDSIISASAGQLGAKHMLTLAWIKSNDATVIRRHSETLGEDVAQFDTGVEQAVAALFERSVSQAAKITGTWSTSWGNGRLYSEDSVILFEQRGDSFTGSYDGDQGRYEGTVDGNLMEGTWVRRGKTGRFRWILDAAGNSFTGSWSLGDGDLLYWQKGTRQPR